MTLIIAQLGLEPTSLHGETVIVTGAGGGIGYEAARALLWLGANLVIAEINAQSGAKAAQALGAEFDPERVLFVASDVGDEASVQSLYTACMQRFGKVDAVINNATIAVLGAVTELPIESWDASYRVNLRGPVLLARAFLPDMLRRKHGAFICVSSTGTAYLGGYETFKAAQVHLANTLDAELEGTGVVAFTIGPGLIPTETARRAVERLAPRMGMSVEQFFELNKNAVLTAEEAGARIIQAAPRQQALALCRQARRTLEEQSDGWKKRSLFERQWVLRDFKKTAGMSAEEWLDALRRLESGLQGDGAITLPPLAKLAAYYLIFRYPEFRVGADCNESCMISQICC